MAQGVKDLVFVDIETTGLDPSRHQVVEIAWADWVRPVQTMVVEHTLENAEKIALEVNGYYERRLDEALQVSREGVAELLGTALAGKIFVGSNPAFDQAFLEPIVGPVWHHRKIDVTSMALVMLGQQVPQGLTATIAALRDQFDLRLPKQDHTAEGDVIAARAVYQAVLEWREMVSGPRQL